MIKDWFFQNIEIYGLFIEGFLKEHFQYLIIKSPNLINPYYSSIELLKNIYGYEKNHQMMNHSNWIIVFDFLYPQINTDLYLENKKENLFKWIKNNSVERNCVICGAIFKPIRGPYWVYFRSNKNDQCCMTCKELVHQERNEVLEKIPIFIDTCGFIPNSDFGPITRSFTKVIESNKINEVIKLICSIGGIYYIKELFGNWIEALYQSKVISKRMIKGSKSYKCIAEDGDICNSLAELYIDNWLYKNNIKHKKEPFYPKHALYNPNGKYRGDWLLDDGTFIEYFGLNGDIEYDKRIEAKLEIVKEFSLKFIPIYPNEIKLLETIIKN
jgi:hypothetical protein